MNSFTICLRVPPDTPPEEPIFLAGSFNNWLPDLPEYRFEHANDGRLRLRLTSVTPVFECKLTRGSWSKTECRPSGKEAPNRLVRATGRETTVDFSVHGWSDHANQQIREKAVFQLLHPAFEIPQLGRKRRIWAMLPPDYHRRPEKRYPVIYMQDGQNLFDNPQAVYGSWNVDKAFDRLFVQNMREAEEALTSTIVIGIENGGDHRISEYSPWINSQYGGGEGKRYLSFICDTLKPFVDQTLRTETAREHTGILGSSMGGLISLCAALTRPDVFGMAGVFSPSLWFSENVFTLAKTQKRNLPVKILLMAGHRESETMVSDLLNLYETLLEAGHEESNLHYDLHSDGAHSEWFWAREFEHAFSWLLEDGCHGHHEHSFHDKSVVFERDEAKKELIVQLNHALRAPVLEVHDYCHERVFRHPMNAHQQVISYAAWEDCVYSIRLLSDDDLVFSRRVHLNQLKRPIQLFNPKTVQL